jgi:hypothetical protein
VRSGDWSSVPPADPTAATPDSSRGGELIGNDGPAVSGNATGLSPGQPQLAPVAPLAPVAEPSSTPGPTPTPTSTPAGR